MNSVALLNLACIFFLVFFDVVGGSVWADGGWQSRRRSADKQLQPNDVALWCADGEHALRAVHGNEPSTAQLGVAVHRAPLNGRVLCDTEGCGGTPSEWGLCRRCLGESSPRRDIHDDLSGGSRIRISDDLFG